MATNRQDTLDPALLRPGRLDRKIEFPLPSRRERRLIFQTVTSKMNLGPDVDLEDCERVLIFLKFSMTVFCPDVSRPDRLSSAEISSVVQAAGLQGIPPSFLPFLCRLIKIRSGSKKSLCHSSN
jgi:26S proteasome regulatory subunit T3